VNAPRHHPTEEDLFAYATGTANEAVAVLVACHLTFCPACRAEVAAIEAVGAALGPGPAPVPPVLPSAEALLARAAPEARPDPVTADEVFPAPLRERVGPAAGLPWRRLPMGVAHAAIELQGGHCFLYDFPAGLVLPSHHHQGLERAMPLTGGFTDDEGTFGVGDVSLKAGHRSHQVRIDEGERCVCLFVNDGAIVPDNLALRLAAKLSGLS